MAVVLGYFICMILPVSSLKKPIQIWKDTYKMFPLLKEGPKLERCIEVQSCWGSLKRRKFFLSLLQSQGAFQHKSYLTLFTTNTTFCFTPHDVWYHHFYNYIIFIFGLYFVKTAGLTHKTLLFYNQVSIEGW